MDAPVSISNGSQSHGKGSAGRTEGSAAREGQKGSAGRTEGQRGKDRRAAQEGHSGKDRGFGSAGRVRQHRGFGSAGRFRQRVKGRAGRTEGSAARGGFGSAGRAEREGQRVRQRVKGRAGRGSDTTMTGGNLQSLTTPKVFQLSLNFKCRKSLSFNSNDNPPVKPTRNARQKKLAEHGSAAQKPNPTTRSTRVKNRGVALSVKDVRHKVHQLLRSPKDSGPHLQTAHDGQTPAAETPRTDVCGSKPSKVVRTPNAEDIKLPEKYSMLGEFFDCMESAIRLLRLRKTMCSFRNICPQVESMSHRRFMYSHVAQMKHLLPELIQLEKILSHDEKSLCMKPDLKITLLHNALPSENVALTSSNVNSSVVRKTFRTRLLEFVKAHPEGEDVPEDILPEPFNRKALPFPNDYVADAESKSTSRSDTASSTVPVEHAHPESVGCSTLLPQGFQRRFSQRNHLAQAAPMPSHVSDQLQNVNSPQCSKPLARSDAPDGQAPSPVNSHLSPGFKSRFAAKCCLPGISRESMELKESDRLECKSPSTSAHHVSPMLKPSFSVKASHFEESSLKTPTAELVAPESGVIACKNPSSFQDPSSATGTPYHSCERLRKHGFSPATPMFSSSASISDTADISPTYERNVSKSIPKSDIKSSMGKKTLRFENVSSTHENPSDDLSPGTPNFVTTDASVVAPTASVRISNKSSVRKAITFNRPDKNSGIPSFSTDLSACRGRTPGSLKRKAPEPNLDDKWRQCPMQSRIAVNAVMLNSNAASIRPSPAKMSAIPLAKTSENSKGVFPNYSHSFQSPVKEFRLQEVQREGTPTKMLPSTPQLRPLKRARCDETDLEIIRSLPASVVQSVQEREKKALEDCMAGSSAANRRRQMFGNVPKLFRAVRFVFHSEKRSVITHEELVHKLIANNSDITDRGEVVEQLQLLEEVAPDWISSKRASSGDLLYCIDKNADLQEIDKRIAKKL